MTTDLPVIAGDIGGTNSRLAVYEGQKPVFERTYPSADHPSLEHVLVAFVEELDASRGNRPRPERACLAVAGPVENRTAEITNLGWHVDAQRLEEKTRLKHIRLANDFEAAASGVTLVGAEHLVPLGGGHRRPNGPVVVAGPGTGLGMAFLFWSEGDRGYRVTPSEGGHTDFAPRTPIERGLAAYLARVHGRATCERVLSGPGIENIFNFLMEEPACRSLCTAETRQALLTEDAAAVIGSKAVAGSDPLCGLAINIFCSVLGAVAGNLALGVLATGGVFIAGGISPRLVSILERGLFREAFEAKGRYQPYLARIPVWVVTHPEVGLLGAAALAARDPG